MGDPPGDAAIYPTDCPPAVITADCIKLDVDTRLSSNNYVLYCLQSSLVKAQIADITKGVAHQKVSLETFRTLALPVAPIAEQRCIVAKIDSLSAKSKRAREHLNHVPRLVEKYKDAVLTAAYRGDFLNGYQHGAISLKGLISEPIRNGLSVRGADTPPGTRALKLSALRSGTVNLSDVRYLPIDANRASRYLLRQGDVLISRGNGNLKLVGISAVVPDLHHDVIFPDTAFRVRLSPRDALPKWLHFMWTAPQVRLQLEALAKTTAGIWKLSQSDLNAVRLPRMNLEDQVEIVRRIETAFAWIDRLAAEATSARKLIDHLDQAILSKAFRGELVPQDPNDEPASVLLERIRMERAGTTADKGSRGRRSRIAGKIP
jgi:type I restriction enzyme S subunit